MSKNHPPMPNLSTLVDETLAGLSPIQSIMKVADPKNIRKMGLEPEEVISFGGGWCNHRAPDGLRDIYREICADAAAFHSSGRYSAIVGNYEFRERLCDFERAIFSVGELHPENICVGHSATQLFHDILRVLCDPGDGIALLDPTYVNYFNAIKCALPGSKVHFLPALDPDSWEYMADPEKPLEELKSLVEDRRIKALVIPDPDNPTSQILPEKFLRSVLDILGDKDVFLVLDHAYETQYFGEMPGAYSWSPVDIPNLVTIHSNSKWISSLGRRLGWLEAGAGVIDGMEKMVESTLLSPDTLHSTATARFLDETLSDGSLKTYIDDMRNLYERTARVTMDSIDRHLGLPRLEPMGGLYTCVKIGEDPVGFTEDILRNTGVLFIPGTGFGPSMDEAVRISYGPLCYDHDRIEEGMEKVGNYIKSGDVC